MTEDRMINWKAILKGIILSLILTLIFIYTFGVLSGWMEYLIAGFIVGYMVGGSLLKGTAHGVIVGAIGGIISLIFNIMAQYESIITYFSFSGGIVDFIVQITSSIIIMILSGALGGAVGAFLKNDPELKIKID